MATKQRKYLINNVLRSKQDEEDEVFMHPGTEFWVTEIVPGFGSERYKRTVMPDFVQAMLVVMGMHEQDRRAMIYFENPNRTGYNIPKDLYPHYLALHNLKTGENWAMPPWKTPLNPKTKG